MPMIPKLITVASSALGASIFSTELGETRLTHVVEVVGRFITHNLSHKSRSYIDKEDQGSLTR